MIKANGGAETISAPLDLSFHLPRVDIPERVHENYCMAFWQVQGRTQFRCDQTQFELSPDEVAWLPAGTKHALAVQENSVVFALIFRPQKMATVLNELTVVKIRPEERIYFQVLYQSNTSIIQPAVDVERQVLSILESRALAPADLPLPVSAVAARIAQALLSNPGDGRRVVDWALSCHISARSLERAFIEETGLTLRQWRTKCRMFAAARLLRAGSMASSVAHRVGYQNHSSFARAFRQFHGTNPSQYAALALSSNTGQIRCCPKS